MDDRLRPGASIEAWAAHWATLAEQGRRIASVMAQDGEDRFARLARRFEEEMREGGEAPADPLLAVVLPLARDARVVDVGAGVGRFTLPLAGAAREVVAVEPSPAMRERLEAHIRERNVANVRVVAEPFEEAALEPADLVLCAHVVHFVADAPGFIRKVDGLARRAVAFAIRHDAIQAPLLALWSRYRGDPPPRQPMLADLYNLLLAMGYAPDVRFYRRRHPSMFADLAEACTRIRAAVGVDVGEAEVRQALAQQPEELREACVWWVKGQAAARGVTQP